VKTGLSTLLEMSGETFFLEDGYWCKIEAWEVVASKERPHGIRYNLTLHDRHNTRLFGMDNAHIPLNRRKGFHGRVVEYDHMHVDEKDRGTPYSFEDAGQLIADFWERVDLIIKRLE